MRQSTNNPIASITASGHATANNPATHSTIKPIRQTAINNTNNVIIVLYLLLYPL